MVLIIGAITVFASVLIGFVWSAEGDPAHFEKPTARK
jgi:flagellar motor component MotA